MRKQFILLSFLLSGLMPAKAQQSEQKAPFTGVWQLFRPQRSADGSMTLQFQPSWKIYNADGSFITFMWPPYEGRFEAFITNKGDYKLKNDSLYTEDIKVATMNPQAVGTQNQLDFHLVSEGTYLALSYGKTETGKKIGELWHNVGKPGKATDKSNKTGKLAGLWQYCKSKGDANGNAYAYYPVWKYLYEDGSFITFGWTNVRKASQASAWGSYTVDSDDTYTEHVADSPTDPELYQRKSVLNYRIEGDTILHASYTMPGRTQAAHETWKRIRPGVVPQKITPLHQGGPKPEIKKDNKGIYLSAEKDPVFEGGAPALNEFINANFNYPSGLKDRDIKGKTLVRFVVRKDGSVTDPVILVSVDPQLDKECLRVVSLLKFTPGRVNNEAVDCYFSLPIGHGGLPKK